MTTSAAAGKYLTFYLGAEEFGIEILRVHEIIGVLPITRVPRTSPFVRGVVNLRGRVISIVDLRLRFDMAPADPGPRSCIIVVRANDAHVGLLVDQVSEVADIADGQIEPPPTLGAGAHTDYLIGIANTAARVRLLLDIDRVLGVRELAAHDAAPSDPSSGATSPGVA
ncbi:MAG TPA: chemotaxis protein CheW [Gemmatimonadaceae bacterium]|jgi:purine-binding chemotaxis protein CheW